MPLRNVAPLNEQQWSQVQKMMKEGPTEQSMATVKQSLERAAKLRKMPKF